MKRDETFPSRAPGAVSKRGDGMRKRFFERRKLRNAEFFRLKLEIERFRRAARGPEDCFSRSPPCAPLDIRRKCRHGFEFSWNPKDDFIGAVQSRRLPLTLRLGVEIPACSFSRAMLRNERMAVVIQPFQYFKRVRNTPRLCRVVSRRRARQEH